MRNGWRLLANCRLGDLLIPIVLIKPGAGVALIEISPAWTPTAITMLRRRMAAEGFEQRFTGYLPMVHRRVRTEDLPKFDAIVTEAFLWQDPISIQGEGSWADAVQAALTPSPPVAVPPPPARARRAYVGAAALTAACAAGGGLLLLLQDGVAERHVTLAQQVEQAPPAARSLALVTAPDAAGLLSGMDAAPVASEGRRTLRPAAAALPEWGREQPAEQQELASAALSPPGEVPPWPIEIASLGLPEPPAEFAPLPAQAPRAVPEPPSPSEFVTLPAQVFVGEAEADGAEAVFTGAGLPMAALPAPPRLPDDLAFAAASLPDALPAPLSPTATAMPPVPSLVAAALPLAAIPELLRLPGFTATEPLPHAVPAPPGPAAKAMPPQGSWSAASFAEAPSPAIPAAPRLPDLASTATLPEAAPAPLDPVATATPPGPVAVAAPEPAGPAPSLAAPASPLSMPPQLPRLPDLAAAEPDPPPGMEQEPPAHAATAMPPTPTAAPLPAVAEPPGLPDVVAATPPLPDQPLATMPAPTSIAPLLAPATADAHEPPDLLATIATPASPPLAGIVAPEPSTEALPEPAAASPSDPPPAIEAEPPPTAEAAPPPAVLEPPAIVAPVQPQAARTAQAARSAPDTATAAPPLAAPPARPDPLEPMLRRGQALMEIGDVSGARRFFRRAAEGGSAAGAQAMAETHDPDILRRRGVIGLPPDRAAALSWYRRALALGAPEAASRIARLEAEQ